jgi:membrane protein DedA with SNARE-associated domain
MPLRRFMLFNALGAVAWTTTFGLGAYVFGRAFIHLSRPIGLATVVVAALAAVAAIAYVRGKEAQLQRQADAALLGPHTLQQGDAAG